MGRRGEQGDRQDEVSEVSLVHSCGLIQGYVGKGNARPFPREIIGMAGVFGPPPRRDYQAGNPRRESKPHAVSSINAVLRQVVAQRALADPHQLGGVLLDAAGLLEGAADRLALHPLEILVQPCRGQAG